MRAVVVSRTTGDPSVLELVEREPGSRARARCGSASSSRGSTRPTGSPAPARPAGSAVRRGRAEPGRRRCRRRGRSRGRRTSRSATGSGVLLAAHQRPTGDGRRSRRVVPADRVVRLPDAVSYDLGASLGVPAVTAHRALTRRRGVARPAGSRRARAGVRSSSPVERAPSVMPRSSSPAGPAPRSSRRSAARSKAALATAAGGAPHGRLHAGRDRPRDPWPCPGRRGLHSRGGAGDQRRPQSGVVANHGTIAVYAEQRRRHRVTLDVRTHVWTNVRYQLLPALHR